jgi:hypothetical protein
MTQHKRTLARRGYGRPTKRRFQRYQINRKQNQDNSLPNVNTSLQKALKEEEERQKLRERLESIPKALRITPRTEEQKVADEARANLPKPVSILMGLNGNKWKAICEEIQELIEIDTDRSFLDIENDYGIIVHRKDADAVTLQNSQLKTAGVSTEIQYLREKDITSQHKYMGYTKTTLTLEEIQEGMRIPYKSIKPNTGSATISFFQKEDLKKWLEEETEGMIKSESFFNEAAEFKCFVGNIPRNQTDSEFIQFLGNMKIQYQAAKILKDADDNRPLGCAIIDFKDIEDQQDFLKLHGLISLGKNTLQIKEYKKNARGNDHDFNPTLVE